MLPELFGDECPSRVSSSSLVLIKKSRVDVASMRDKE